MITREVSKPKVQRASEHTNCYAVLEICHSQETRRLMIDMEGFGLVLYSLKLYYFLNKLKSIQLVKVDCAMHAFNVRNLHYRPK
jgi:hypothetical protein